MIRFQPRDKVWWESTNSGRRLGGTVIKRLAHERALVDDGTGLTPRVMRAERLRFGIPARPSTGAAA